MLVLHGFPDLVSLRSVESCLFHHPAAEVTMVLQAGGEELERQLAALQEVGYSINVTRQLEPGLPSPFPMDGEIKRQRPTHASIVLSGGLVLSPQNDRLRILLSLWFLCQHGSPNRMK